MMQTILNTRPSHQSHDLTKGIEQLGKKVFHLPIFDIQPVSFSRISLEDFSYIIFQSSNAVNFFLQQQNVFLTEAKIIAIGSATENALRDAGIRSVLTPDAFSSEGILAMPSLQHVTDEAILIISGENPKHLLAETLRQRGARVDTVYSYRRVPIQHNMTSVFQQLMQHKINTIISTSSESFFHLMQLFQAPSHHTWILEKSLCVINEKMRAEALAQGFKCVIQADNATDAAIIKALAV